MRISGSTRVSDLLKQYPLLADFLASYNPRFEVLRNRMARATLGRVATLQTAAGMAGVELGALLNVIADEIQRSSGVRPEIDLGEAPHPTIEERKEILKEIITSLHEGVDPQEARLRFAEAVRDVEPSEIASMEEELISEGLPVTEVQRLCDVHVGTFRQALDQQAEVQAPPGHPVHTYLQDNQIIGQLANELGALAAEVQQGRNGTKAQQAVPVIEKLLEGIDNHYQRKEYQLFPVLERHGVTGSAQVMWGVDDQIRDKLKSLREAAEREETERFAGEAPAVVRDLVEMIYKEEKILFPMALESLSEDDWAEIRKGEDELGYVLSKPAADWPGYASVCAEPVKPQEGVLKLTTGQLTPEQVDLVLTHVPVEISFVDENDTVQYYSERERIFPRSPGVIGRKVQKCHPPDSVHVVQSILDAFRSGGQSVAEFWIQHRGRFVEIRYFAVRDSAGAYRGCLEVCQDITEIRKLEGERRLLDWERHTS